MCSYTATLSPLVDLRRLGEGAWGAIWQDWNTDWRKMQAEGRIDPVTWDLGDLALDAGSPGVIFPSTAAPGGTNVVLFPEALVGKGTIVVNDPQDTLPHDQASWS